MKNTSILLALTLTFLSACGGSESEQQTQTNTQTQKNPVTKTKPETKNNKTPEKPVVTEKKPTTPKNSTVSGLIPSTNPEERLNQISQGKNNPFNSITPPAVVNVTSDNIDDGNDNTDRPISVNNLRGVRNSEIVRNPDGSVNRNIARNRNTGNVDNVENDENVVENIDNNNNETNIENVVEPEPPQPLEAESVSVSGIVDILGQNVALVQTPWDGTTRSVKVGDVISDDTGNINIVVRDISFGFGDNAAFPDVNQVVFRNLNNSEGTVLLEQNGQTVSVEVSDVNTAIKTEL